MNSARNLLLALAVLIACVAAASIASANSTAVPRAGVHNGVITACVEPPTKGNRATSGDLNFLICLKGARQISWNIRGPRGLPGAVGKAGPQGTPGANGSQVPLVRQDPQAHQVQRAIPERPVLPGRTP